jgi:hypothetical protein
MALLAAPLPASCFPGLLPLGSIKTNLDSVVTASALPMRHCGENDMPL